jgi:hypothetical protein
MDRAARMLVVLVASVLVDAGCGGGGESAPGGGLGSSADPGGSGVLATASGAKQLGAKHSASKPHALGQPSIHKRKAKGSHRSPPAAHRVRHGAKKERSAARHEAGGRHQPKTADRVKLTLQSARALLATFGLKDADVSVSKKADAVRIGVPAGKACGLPPKAEQRIVSGIKVGTPWVRSVAVSVGGSGLDSYTASNCRPVEPPEGRGERVFEQTGNGIVTTRAIEITGRHWSVSYANYGGFFSVNVEKDGQVTSDYLYSQAPGSGRKTFASGPGKIVLKIGGPAWAVQVYDGR